MSHDNYHFNEMRRSLRRVAADLRGRADELDTFIGLVDAQVEERGEGEFIDPRSAFFDNVQRALDDAGRTQQFDQHAKGTLGALMRAYADEYHGLASRDEM